MMKGSTLILLSIFSILLTSQCTKEEMMEEEMTMEPIIKTLELIPLCEMPSVLPEISGIITLENGYLTHNDGGGGNILYTLSENCGIEKEHTVVGAINNDWESITQDDEYIYIGDFGNNDGDRMNLSIYKIAKTTNLNEDFEVVEKLEFSYNDQTTFDNKFFHDFDCEAMIPWDDSIYLFSKNRSNSKTNIYALEKSGSAQVIQQIGTLDSTNMVTDALYNEERDELWILAYQVQFVPGGTEFANKFIIVENFSENKFENSTVKIKEIDERYQFESMTLIDKDNILLTHERESGGSSMLYSVTIPEN